MASQATAMAQQMSSHQNRLHGGKIQNQLALPPQQRQPENKHTKRFASLPETETAIMKHLDEFCLCAGVGGGRPATFPWVLYCMVEDCTSDLDSNRIVSWVEHGRAFHIHDRKLFQEHIMPR